jgi:hypothetical protein
LFRTTGSTRAPAPRCPSPPKFGFVSHLSSTRNLALPKPGRNGFVCTDGPRGPEAAAGWAVRPQLCLQSAIERLGSFCAFVPRPTSPRPHPTRRSRELALLCTFGSIRDPTCLSGVPDWLCFAQMASDRNGGMMECWNIGAPNGRHGRNWLCFARLTSPDSPSPRCPILPKFGFVLHNRLFVGWASPPDTSPNWVRFAHSPSVPRPWGLVPPGLAANWLRFARWASSPR